MPSLKQDRERYWRSLDELAETGEFRKFVDREFPGLEHELPDSASRRHFLKLMGASILFAGLVGCQWPEDIIAPHAHRPEGRLPGVPVHYATIMELAGISRGLLVTSYDGRPIKIEGNPGHPQERGGADLLAQASILELYDPDRTRIPAHRGEPATWDDFRDFLRERLANMPEGKGLYILGNGSGSPTLARMRARLLERFPQARWYDFEAFSRDNEREGSRIAFGRTYRTDLMLAKARIILSLDADLLMTHPAAGRYAREYADGRMPEAELNRLYVIESRYSVTGTNADHRFAIAPSEFPALCLHLAAELVSLGVSFEGGEWRFDSLPALPRKWKFLHSLAKDLAANRGRSVVAAGPAQPPAVHALVHAINAALEAPGSTVVYYPEEDSPSTLESIQSLSADMKNGEVETLLILGGNPAFDAPADLSFGDLLESIPDAVHLGLHGNETAQKCAWNLPMAHYLESWGDGQAWDGVYSVCQPLIAPLYEGKSPLELLALVLDEEQENIRSLVRQTFDSLKEGLTEEDWQHTIRDGFLGDSAFASETSPIDGSSVVQSLHKAANAVANGQGAFEVIFAPDYTIHDGRFANNAWLQELPDPVSKVVWDNPALVSLKTSESIGARHGDMIRLSLNGRTLDVPAFIVPGVAANTIVLTAGYGHTAGGRVANGTGYSVFDLRTVHAWNAAKLDGVAVTGARANVVTTQDHYMIDALGREERERRSEVLIQEMTPATFAAAADRPSKDEEPNLQLVASPKVETGHKWAMTIDLSRCIGCNACVVGCQAENNIPIVGKDQVAVGREMHWLRIDRYFRGDPEDPEAAHQPVPCMHCDNAPCEQVCPVAATVQSKEGLNVMVYNRCVGTRYCANNCPWKVRRFNYFNLNLNISDVEKMQKNPEVTIRARGVMEKCTYCVQRIERTKILARNEDRPIADGEIMPACAQSCPTKAIIFGDLADEESRVASIQHKNPRDYETLEKLGNKARTRYLARMRNPNPELSETQG